MSPFDVVKHLNEKSNLDFEMKDYAPWIINKALSFHNQTIHFANAMNKCAGLDKDIQYKFYKEGIPKGKRWGAWQKKTPDTELIELIRHIYSCNSNVARQYASLMSEEEKQRISESKGGRNGTR